MERAKRFVSFLDKNIYFVVTVLFFVGIVGTVNSETRNLFVNLTPFFLLLISALLMIYFVDFKDNKSKIRNLVFLVFVFYFTLIIELVSIKTGFPFGFYDYSDLMGIRFVDVPIIVGFLWVIVVIGGIGFLQFVGIWNSKFKNIIALLGAFLLVFLDFLIEPVAITLNYWRWDNIYPPYTNYISWFFISLVCFFVAKTLQVNFKSYKVGYFIFVNLFLYFVVLNILL